MMNAHPTRASMISTITLAAETCSALSGLQSLCQIPPGQIHAVHNEVTDLHFVLSQVSSLIDAPACLRGSQLSAIPCLLERASRALTDIKSITDCLTLACIPLHDPVLSARPWKKEQDRLQCLKEDLRAVKATLNTIVGASNSQLTKEILLDIQAASTTTSRSPHGQATVNDSLNKLAAIDKRIATVEEFLRAQANQVHSRQFEQIGSYDVLAPSRPEQIPQSKEICPSILRSDSIDIAPPKRSCRPGCLCACHSPKKSTSPTAFNRFLGRLSIGHRGLPLFRPRCNLEGCKKSPARHINVEYWLPVTSSPSSIVRLQLSNIGPRWHLDKLRRVPDTAQSITFAMSGNITGLQHLFEHGLASPRDVSTTRGYSLLRWALYAKQYPTCKYLMHAGADADYQPVASSDNSPRFKACQYLLEGGLDEHATDALRTMTGGGGGGFFESFIDEAGFTEAHKIVLGLSSHSHSLDDELVHNPWDIDAADTIMGRTPLSWAAARGDARAMTTLLSGHGADPNTMDAQLSGPLCNAAAQGHSVAVRMLLEAGAQPDPGRRGGGDQKKQKGSALNCAARNASTDVAVLKSLLDFGADVDAAGADGTTALIHAARTDRASFAMLLLEYGADGNARTADGATPLTTAIAFNSHAVLRLLLGRWLECAGCPRRLKGPRLLQTAAMYADGETLRMLAMADHSRIKYDGIHRLGACAKLLRQRPDWTDDLAWAFDRLLAVVSRQSQKHRLMVDRLGMSADDLAGDSGWIVRW